MNCRILIDRSVLTTAAAAGGNDADQCDVTDTRPGHLLLGIVGSSSATVFVFYLLSFSSPSSS